MEAIRIKGTAYVPNVTLDKDANIFEIAGRSLPEDVSSFYNPILAWLTEYANNANPITNFVFKLTYYNTASSKLILNLMLKLEEVSNKGNDVRVKWYFPEDDEDLQEAGEEYAELVDIPFEQIQI